MTPPVAELEISAAYVGGAQILGPISLRVRPGDTLAIQGPSGVGKTTLLRVLAGLETDVVGQRKVTEALGVVFQEPMLLPWRGARDNLTLITKCSAARADALLNEVGLGDKAEAYPGQLSLGQQRRLALARALAAEPALLLLDEPFVSLDAHLAQEMVQLLSRACARRDMATVIVTHAASEARALATRILTLGGVPATCVAETDNTQGTAQAGLRAIPRAGS